MLALEFLVIMCFGTIAFQDIKERMVNWILFPLVGILLMLIHLYNTDFNFFLLSTCTNFLIITSMIIILWSYTKLIKRKKFLNSSFGLGDILFLYAFALGFPPISFIVLLASSICFSLLAFTILNYFRKEETVPLAGLMGIFLIIILILEFFTDRFSLYII